VCGGGRGRESGIVGGRVDGWWEGGVGGIGAVIFGYAYNSGCGQKGVHG